MDDSPRQTMTDNDKKPINSDTIEDTRWAQLSFSFLVSVTDPAELVSPLAATLKPQKKTRSNEWCSEYHSKYDTLTLHRHILRHLHHKHMISIPSIDISAAELVWPLALNGM